MPESSSSDYRSENELEDTETPSESPDYSDNPDYDLKGLQDLMMIFDFDQADRVLEGETVFTFEGAATAEAYNIRDIVGGHKSEDEKKTKSSDWVKKRGEWFYVGDGESPYSSKNGKNGIDQDKNPSGSAP